VSLWAVANRDYLAALDTRLKSGVSRSVSARDAGRPRTSRVRGAVRSQRGQGLVEFALLTPIVLLFLGAIITFGLAMFARSNLQQAMREGARQAAVGASLTDVQNLAAGNAPEQLAPGDVQWCHPVGPSGTQGQVGDPVRVYIKYAADGQEGYPFNLVPTGSIFGGLFGANSATVRMSPRATARLEKSVAAPVNC
jgi:uncharacterized protein (UPF0333 family)